MPSLETSQTAFGRALMAKEAAPPDDLMRRDGQPTTRRFSVYRNTMRSTLIEALAATYPVCQRLVGEAFFEAMALTYVEQHPPRSRIMLDYGGQLAEFIAAFPPARSLPYLGDVARLEWAQTRAYHAADVIPVGADDFASVPADQWAQITVDLHPAVRILRSPYPILAIWRTNSRDEMVHPIDLNMGGEDVLVTRPELDVELCALPPGGAAFLTALESGHSMLAAAENALADDPAFDLSRNIGGLIEAGVVATLKSDNAQNLTEAPISA